MSNYDKFLNDDSPKPKGGKGKKSRRKQDRESLWNLMTVVMVLLTLCVCIVFVNILGNPYSWMNPLPPATVVPPPNTPTWTPLGYEPTWTPTVTIQPTETSTPRPTFTIEPSATLYSLATSTPPFTATSETTATRTPKPTGVPYKVTVSTYESTAFRPDTSCASMFVAGQALDAASNPVKGLQVRLGGSIPGKSFNNPTQTTLTGISLTYGPSGFEFDLQIQPVSSNKTLWVQLLDQAGSALSEQVYLTTYNDCKKNLIFVRFQQK